MLTLLCQLPRGEAKDAGKQAPMHAMQSSLDKPGRPVLDTTHHRVEDTLSAVIKSLP